MRSLLSTIDPALLGDGRLLLGTATAGILIVPSALAAWMVLAGRLPVPARRTAIITVSLVCGLAGLALLCLCLALAGGFTAATFGLTWLACLGSAAWRAGRSADAASPAWLSAWRRAAPTPWPWLAIVGVWAILYARPFEMVLAGRDPGTYLSTAASLATRGEFPVADPLFALLPASLRDGVLWYPPWLGRYLPFRFPGYFWIDPPTGEPPAPGYILPQFFPLYPSLMAPAFHLGAWRAALGVLPWLMLALVLVVMEATTELARSFRTRPAADERKLPVAAWTAGAILATHPVMLWFGRYANAEICLGTFLLGGLLVWAWHHTEADRPGAESGKPGLDASGPLFALLLGCALLAKVDVLYLLPAPLVALQIDSAWRDRTARHRTALVWIVIAGIYLLVVRNLVSPYIATLLQSDVLAVAPDGPAPLVAALLVVTAISVAGLVPPLLAADGVVFRAAAALGLGPRALWPTVTAAAVGLGLVTAFIASPGWWGVIGAFHNFFADWTWPSLLLCGVGAAVCLRRRDPPGLSTVILLTLASSGAFLVLRTPGDDHPWNLRRGVAVIVPLACALAGLGMQWIADRALTARQRQVALPLALLLTIAPWRSTVRLLMQHREAPGAVELVTSLDKHIPRNAVLYGIGGPAADFLDVPMFATAPREVLNSRSREGAMFNSPQALRALIEEFDRRGRPFLLMSDWDGPPHTEGIEWGAYYWQDFRLRRRVATVAGARPSTEEIPVPIRIWRARPKSPPRSTEEGDWVRVWTHEAEGLPASTGTIAREAAGSDRWVRVAHEGEDTPGVLTSGARCVLPAGRYVATFHVRTRHGDPTRPHRARIHTVAPEPIASIELPSDSDGFVPVSVPYYLAHAEPLVEYRLEYSGAGDVEIDRIDVDGLTPGGPSR